MGICHCNTKCDTEFDTLKKNLCSDPILAPLRWFEPLRCNIDASKRGVGSTFIQLEDEDHESVIAYFSKRLSSSEENYTVNDRDLSALYYSVKVFLCFLDGRTFEFFTDNQVLRYFYETSTKSKGS